MRCRDLMTTTVHTCRDTDTAYRCAQLMRRENIGFVPVVDAEMRVVGVVTDRDLAVRVLAAARPPTTELRDVMTTDIATCEPDEELRTAEQCMAKRRVSRVLIISSFRRCLGILSLSDVVRVEESRRAGELLRSVTARESVPPPSFR